MNYRDLTINELLNVSRKFNLLKLFADKEYDASLEDNEVDIIKTWVALIKGSVSSISIDSQTLDDLTIIDALTGQAVKQEIINITQVVETPPITPTIAQIPFQVGNPTFTLHDAIETSSVTFWGVKTGYKTQNLGRAIHIDEAVKYPVNLSGVGQYDTLEIRVNHSQANFTVDY